MKDVEQGFCPFGCVSYNEKKSKLVSSSGFWCFIVSESLDCRVRSDETRAGFQFSALLCSV